MKLFAQILERKKLSKKNEAKTPIQAARDTVLTFTAPNRDTIPCHFNEAKVAVLLLKEYTD